MIAPLMKCWLCGAPADSAEHRFKKADLIRAHGKGRYKGPSALVHVRSGVVSPIQGPRSSMLKYEQSLCHSCNTARTQPYDNAYDRLIDWVMENEQAALRKRLINFEEIYGLSHEEYQLNLFRYCVKSFGCRLVETGQTVPKDLVDLLPLTSFRTGLKITFSVNEDVLLLPEQDRVGFIGKGELMCRRSRTAPSIIHSYVWSEHVSWFTICYWYGCEPEGGLGSTWIANSQYVYLGSHAPVPVEQRAEFLHKLQNRSSET
jgi:hypothetical protein